MTKFLFARFPNCDGKLATLQFSIVLHKYKGKKSPITLSVKCSCRATYVNSITHRNEIVVGKKPVGRDPRSRFAKILQPAIPETTSSVSSTNTKNKVHDPNSKPLTIVPIRSLLQTYFHQTSQTLTITRLTLPHTVIRHIPQLR